MRRSSIASTLVLAGVIASPVLLHAQANPTSADERDTTAITDTSNVTQRDHDGGWGWLGLLGLAGLMGLRRPERDKRREQVNTRQPI